MTSPTSQGICTNLPAACSHAAARTPVPMPDPDTRCPECKARLLPTVPMAPVAHSGPSLAAWVVGGLVALMLGVVFWIFLRGGHEAPTAASAKGGASEVVMVAASAAMVGSGAKGAAVLPAPGTQILRVHGSNTVGAALAPALMEAFLREQGYTEMTQKPGANPEERVLQAHSVDGTAKVEVQLHAHGTATAFTDLAAGQADVGMASRPIKKEELSATQALGDLASAGSEHVIALDGVAVVIHPGNPVQRLSLAQLRGIFSGQVQSWAEVGGQPGPIKVLGRDDKSGTWDTFKALVMGKEGLVAGAQRFEDSAKLSDTVALDPQAIGFIGLPYVRNARALAISDGTAAPLRPSRFTVATEDYPLSRRLFLYVSPKAPELARRFAQFAVSDAAQKVADAQGFIGQAPDAADAAPVASAADLPPAYRALTGQARRLSVNLRFLPGADALDNKARRDLDRIVKLLERRAAQNERVLLLGFSDNSGEACANELLSQQRADAMGRELATYGVRSAVVHGFGPAAPVAGNDSPAGRERNRRVEVWLTSADVKGPARVVCH